MPAATLPLSPERAREAQRELATLSEDALLYALHMGLIAGGEATYVELRESLGEDLATAQVGLVMCVATCVAPIADMEFSPGEMENAKQHLGAMLAAYGELIRKLRKGGAGE